jgi:hypothetical protein
MASAPAKTRRGHDGAVRRFLALGAAWALAAAVAAGVAWAGIGVVGDQVTDERPAPLSAAEVASRLDEPAPETTEPGPGSTTATSAPSAGAPSTTVGGETKTYDLTGGSVSVRFSPSGVTLLWARPHDGFEVDTDANDRVRVEFESDTHESRLEAWWQGGPRQEVEEDDRGGGDDDGDSGDGGDSSGPG